MAIVLRLLLFIVLPALSAHDSNWNDPSSTIHYNQTSGVINHTDNLDLPSYINTASETTETESTTLTLIHHVTIDLGITALGSFLKLTPTYKSLPHHILSYLSLFSNSPPR